MLLARQTLARIGTHSRIVASLFATALCATAAQAAAPAAPAVSDWAAAARRDIEFAATTMAAQHAGVAAGVPSVTVPLETGVRAGLAEAANVRDAQDYRRLMMRFIAGFGDPHTGIDLHQSTSGWTGLVIDRVDGTYRVVWSEAGGPSALPPTGATAESCDGVWFGTYLKTQVAPFFSDSVEYPTTFSTLAQQSMLEQGFGWTPKTCVFALADGSRKTYTLSMRSLEDAPASARLDNALRTAHAEAAPVGATPLGSGKAWGGKTWGGMPSFGGARHGAAYEALYAKLAALPRSGWVIFDLRGNSGGDSSWGTRALAALFGQAFADRVAEAGERQEYMVANANTAALLKHYIARPEFAASKTEMTADLAKVEAATRAGEKMALVKGERGAAAQPIALAKRPHGPRIAAVIDRNCFSSCMNFLQQIRAIDDSVVLGEATIGYSPFGEISAVPLPSGQGTLFIPTAQFKSSQPTRAPFVPDMPYLGNMADDAALQRWIATTLHKSGARNARRR
jgi:hypothetical protein